MRWPVCGRIISKDCTAEGAFHWWRSIQHGQELLRLQTPYLTKAISLTTHGNKETQPVVICPIDKDIKITTMLKQSRIKHYIFCFILRKISAPSLELFIVLLPYCQLFVSVFNNFTWRKRWYKLFLWPALYCGLPGPFVFSRTLLYILLKCLLGCSLPGCLSV